MNHLFHKRAPITPAGWVEIEKEAKRTLRALLAARRVVEWSDAARPTSLRHDAAEAILIGLWGVIDVGWLPGVPKALGGAPLPQRKP